jgi:hypothetical protein
VGPQGPAGAGTLKAVVGWFFPSESKTSGPNWYLSYSASDETTWVFAIRLTSFNAAGPAPVCVSTPTSGHPDLVFSFDPVYCTTSTGECGFTGFASYYHNWPNANPVPAENVGFYFICVQE